MRRKTERSEQYPPSLLTRQGFRSTYIAVGRKLTCKAENAPKSLLKKMGVMARERLRLEQHIRPVDRLQRQRQARHSLQNFAHRSRKGTLCSSRASSRAHSLPSQAGAVIPWQM